MVGNILVVEDEKQQRINFKKMLLELDKNLNIYEAESEEEALVISNEVLIDIFYVDINLKNSSGIDFAKKIRKIEKYEFSWIIFLTAYAQYMLSTFKELHCYDYIIKPYEKKDILNLTKRIILKQQKNTLVVSDRKSFNINAQNGINIKLYLDDLYFIETNLRTCYLHTKFGKFEVKGLGLKKVLKLIDSNDMMQCYKSCAVNIKKIREIQSINCKVSEISFDGYLEKVPLGYKFKNEIIERFR